jgi:hypothetical protein
VDDIIASIDAATGCQRCTKPLGESPSGDFCCEGCQEDWHGERAIALPAEPRRSGIDGYFDDLLRVYGLRMFALLVGALLVGAAVVLIPMWLTGHLT